MVHARARITRRSTAAAAATVEVAPIVAAVASAKTIV